MQPHHFVSDTVVERRMGIHVAQVSDNIDPPDRFPGNECDARGDSRARHISSSVAVGVDIQQDSTLSGCIHYLTPDPKVESVQIVVNWHALKLGIERGRDRHPSVSTVRGFNSAHVIPKRRSCVEEVLFNSIAFYRAA